MIVNVQCAYVSLQKMCLTVETINIKYLCAVSVKHDFLCLRLALRVGHGVLHLVRCVFITPAGREGVQQSEEHSEESEQSVFLTLPHAREECV